VAVGETQMRRLVGRALAVLVLGAGLAGCALPPAVLMAGYVGDGVLVASTGKTPSDVGVSLASGKDCATWHLVKDEDFCQEAAHDEPEAVPHQIAEDEAQAERQIAQAPTEDTARASLTARTLAAALQPVATAEARPAVPAQIAAPAVPGKVVAATAAGHKKPGHRMIAAAPRAKHRVAVAGHHNRRVAAAKGHRHHFASVKRRPTLAAAHPAAQAKPVAKMASVKPVGQVVAAKPVAPPPVLVGLTSNDVVVPPPAAGDRALPRLAAAWSALLAAFTVR